MRRILVAAVLAGLVVTAAVPAVAGRKAQSTRQPTITLKGEGGLFGLDGPADVTVPLDDDPIGRVQAWLPQDPGT